MYKRYVDDVYVEVENVDALRQLKSAFESASVLKFTTEVGLNNKLPFLDVSVNISDTQKHEMSVYRKQTDGGKCLNAASECPQRYKRGVIRSYIYRAIKTCTSWKLLHIELQHIKQMLVNNNFTNTEVDMEVKRALETHFRGKAKTTDKTTLKLCLLQKSDDSSIP